MQKHEHMSPPREKTHNGEISMLLIFSSIW